MYNVYMSNIKEKTFNTTYLLPDDFLKLLKWVIFLWNTIDSDIQCTMYNLYMSYIKEKKTFNTTYLLPDGCLYAVA